MSLAVIQGIVPVLTSALNAIAAFTGSDQAARNSNIITNAVDIIGALGPLVEDFAAGSDVTEEDVRSALAGMDEQLATFDEEIRKRQAAGG